MFHFSTLFLADYFLRNGQWVVWTYGLKDREEEEELQKKQKAQTFIQNSEIFNGNMENKKLKRLKYHFMLE